MSQRFIKFNPDSEEAEFLLEKHPNAFLLLTLIAMRARRTSGSPDGLMIGESHIGDYKKCGIETRDKYRTALEILIARKHVLKMETCRTRQKSPTGTPTIGTKVKLLKSEVWDVNLEVENHTNPHRIPTESPRTRMKECNIGMVCLENEKLVTNSKGVKVESLQSVFQYSVLKDNDWTEKEIRDTYKEIEIYGTKISNTFALMEKLIEKGRALSQNKKRNEQCRQNNKRNLPIKERNTCLDPSVIGFLNGTMTPPLAIYAAQAKLSLK